MGEHLRELAEAVRRAMNARQMRSVYMEQGDLVAASEMQRTARETVEIVALTARDYAEATGLTSLAALATRYLAALDDLDSELAAHRLMRVAEQYVRAESAPVVLQ